MSEQRLALVTPRSPVIEAVDISMHWSAKLMHGGFGISLLGNIGNEGRGFDPERQAVSQQMLETSAGLVVACFDETKRGSQPLPLDRSAMRHLDLADQQGVPIFMQIPYEKVALPHHHKPRRLINIGNNVKLIRLALKEA